MGRAYYADRISPHMSRTPEGFLIIHNQNLARSGYMTYLAGEIDRSDDTTKVEVYRSPATVTAPAHLASLEGKPVTMKHPPKFVNSDTAAWAVKGTVQNVRVGP